jgi:ketosteroid isomerase-like protein
MPPNDFDGAIAEAHSALDQIWKGNPNGYKSLYSKREDITLANPFGGCARGWDEVLERLETAASYFRDGEATQWQTISRSVGNELAYTVEIERGRTKVGGSKDVSDIALRVTCIYRRDDEGWKLLHRHADPRVSRETAESVLEH